MVNRMMLFAGLLLLGIGLFRLVQKISLLIYFLKRRIRDIENGCIAEATVVDFEIVKESDSADATYPVFEFHTLHNEKIQVTEASSSRWELGDKATMIYKEQQPQDTILLTYGMAFGNIVFLFSTALILIFVAAGYYWSQYFFDSL